MNLEIKEDNSMGYPGIFPTGTTVYNKDKAWNGYTVFRQKRAHFSLI